MIKKTILLLLCLTLLLSGCRDKSTPDTVDDDYGETLNTTAAIAGIKPNTLTRYGCILNLDADSYEGVMDYVMEVYENGNWEKIPMPFSHRFRTYTDYVYEPSSVIEMAVNWGVGYGELEPGTYRIVFYEYLADQTTSDPLLTYEFDITEDIAPIHAFQYENFNVLDMEMEFEYIDVNNVEFTVTNNSDKDYKFSQYYAAEELIDDHWQLWWYQRITYPHRKYSADGDFIDYTLRAGDSTVIRLNANYYSESAPGHYRVIFDCYEVNDPSVRYYVSSEFDILADSAQQIQTVAMDILDYSENGASLVLSNTTESTYIFDSAYRIEDIESGEIIFTFSPGTDDSDDDLIELLSNEEPVNIELDWSQSHGALEDGIYLIHKDYYPKDDSSELLTASAIIVLSDEFN